MPEGLLSAVIGGAIGAFATGIGTIGLELLKNKRDRQSIASGIAAEIKVGLDGIPTKPSCEEIIHLSRDGLPYKFYEANIGKLGMLGAEKTKCVIEYYSTRWELYVVGEAFRIAVDKQDAEIRLHKSLANIQNNGSRAILILTKKS
jgi:hypothetical protein